MKLDGPLSQGTCGIGFEIKSPQPAPILAAQLVTGSANPESLPKISMRLGTTRGTNALLEKQGVRVALFVTKGFSDVLQIGTQSRPDLFSLDICKAPPLYTSVVEECYALVELISHKIIEVIATIFCSNILNVIFNI